MPISSLSVHSISSLSWSFKFLHITVRSDGCVDSIVDGTIDNIDEVNHPLRILFIYTGQKYRKTRPNKSETQRF